MGQIRLLEKSANRRGDLFGRLVKDVFLALGYDDHARLNIHKSGREIDLEAMHRAESRRALAECKAKETPIGGDVINKFVGALDAERRKMPGLHTVGYFISLSGFTETAIEQELETGNSRVVLLDAARISRELVIGRIIVSPVAAAERAGRCIPPDLVNLEMEAESELLAHDIGWVWAIYYGLNKQRTHFALVHADGEPLSESVAEAIVAADKENGGVLGSLSYLKPKASPGYSARDLIDARKKYCSFLADECGEIQLEGLPQDQEVGSRRLKLESLFVPLHLVRQAGDRRQDSRERNNQVVSVGEALRKYPRMAILAAPGGGKSTLIKRLAVAYAFPDRRPLVNDSLPDRPWLPVLIRCRQLGSLARETITTIVRAVSERAELGPLTQPFIRLVDESLRTGKVLLLIDGLDEISDDRDRVCFVSQLRTFLATYPHTDVVVTSREAGFRVVGGSLATHCEHFTLAEFTNADIRRLTVAWHREIIGERADIQSEAEKLAQTICDSDRVRRLATNPLLLTTLLLVKRWVGQLPTRRSVLYGKAIEVLLMTWNVEGHEPLEQDEVIPQLAFVAYQMMKDGVQQISARRLRELLISARKQMTDILAYPRLSVSEFVERVESRSSLLMLSGYDVEDGTLCAMYEFRHLTFQEYFSAKAIVEGYYPDRKEDDRLLDVVSPELLQDRWKEVIPLTAVLAGRRAQPLIQHLISLCKERPEDVRYSGSKPLTKPHVLLSRCLLDEVVIPAEMAREALEWIARSTSGGRSDLSIRLLARSKYGEDLSVVVRAAYLAFDSDHSHLGGSLGDITLVRLGRSAAGEVSDQLVERIEGQLATGAALDKAAGALAVMVLAFEAAIEEGKKKEHVHAMLSRLGTALLPLLQSPEPMVQFAVCWAFAWLGRSEGWTPASAPMIIARLVDLWRFSCLPDDQRMAAWPIGTLPLIDRHMVREHLPSDTDLIRWIREKGDKDLRRYPYDYGKVAAYVVGYYLGAPWDDCELAAILQEELKDEKKSPNMVKSLKRLMAEVASLSEVAPTSLSELALTDRIS